MTEFERLARKLAAEKMGLVKDPEGLNLPDDLWMQMCARAGGILAERGFLRRIVDIAWNEATESETVPSSEWADRIIERARVQTAAATDRT